MAENNRKKPDGRGGARPGAGRKPETVSVAQIREMRETAARKAEATGRSLYELVIDWAYDETLSIKDRQTAAKMYLDKMTVDAKEGGNADQNAGPTLFLPEQRPNLEVIEGSKKAG